jgi:hypothetical protein
VRFSPLFLFLLAIPLSPCHLLFRKADIVDSAASPIPAPAPASVTAPPSSFPTESETASASRVPETPLPEGCCSLLSSAVCHSLCRSRKGRNKADARRKRRTGTTFFAFLLALCSYRLGFFFVAFVTVWAFLGMVGASCPPFLSLSSKLTFPPHARRRLVQKTSPRHRAEYHLRPPPLQLERRPRGERDVRCCVLVVRRFPTHPLLFVETDAKDCNSSTAALPTLFIALCTSFAACFSDRRKNRGVF